MGYCNCMHADRHSQNKKKSTYLFAKICLILSRHTRSVSGLSDWFVKLKTPLYKVTALITFANDTYYF